MKIKTSGPKILFLDIETAPILAEVWDIWDQNIGLNQIVKDWSILSWSAKWRGESKIFYHDTSKQKDHRSDKSILPPLWQLMNEADIIVGQNSERFDIPRILSRFLFNKTKKRHLPTEFRQQDTMKMAKKFKLTSYKLEYMAKYFGLKNQKMVKRTFAGHELWKECLKGNKKAWAEMKKYNPIDILTTEELFEVLLPHDKKINYNVYHDSLSQVCSCGSSHVVKTGFRYTNAGKFQDYKCKSCGKRFHGKQNYLANEKRRTMLR